jgi:hypothetical protein
MMDCSCVDGVAVWSESSGEGERTHMAGLGSFLSFLFFFLPVVFLSLIFHFCRFCGDDG